MKITRMHEYLTAPAHPRVWAVIDKAALIHNWRTLAGRVCAASPATVPFAVIKADAYGHGIRPTAEALAEAGCRRFAVACLEEAVALRRVLREMDGGDAAESDARYELLILGYTDPADVSELAENRIATALLSATHARAVDAAARKAGVTVMGHAALDTGMNRIGLPAHTDGEIDRAAKDLVDLMERPASEGGLVVDGLFTHFARSDEDYDTEMREGSLTMTQYARYRRVLDALTALGLRPRVCHVCNSAAAARFPAILPEACLDAVRFGINLYGVGFSDGDVDAPFLRPVMTLRTRVSHIHELLVGETVGYGGTFSADEPRTIATLPIGYADGWRRGLAGATVTIRTAKGDFRVPLVGRVCMDQCMADVTDLPVSVGDEVVMFGLDAQDLEALATRAGTNTYELLCGVSARVPRFYE